MTAFAAAYADEAVGDLAGRLCAWVDGRLDRFGPWHVEGETTPSSLQRFAELAIAYDVLTRSPIDLGSPEQRWRPFIAELVRRPAFGGLARAHLDWAWALLLPYLVLRAHGDVDEYHDTTLSASRAAGFPAALEVVPYRALDYAYFAHRAGLVVAGEGLAGLLEHTYAARARCAYVVDDETAYALTHALLYVSDFGQQPASESDWSRTAAVIDSLIVDCCVRRHYDLLGELLIASLVVPGTRPELRALGLPVFFSTLDDSGSLLPNGLETGRSFEACYHTTMVGLILCASLARAKSGPS